MFDCTFLFVVVLYLNSFYFGIFAVLEFAMCVTKSIALPYPAGNIVSELLLLLFLSGVEGARILLGLKGNLLQKTLFLVLFVIFTAPSTLGVVYYLVWQTYVLKIDMLLCAIQLTFYGLEFLLSLFCIASLFRSIT
ncbi:hypothetical protein R5R35_008553 [Gryllus longicercus]|uniref:Transmembrane protein 216 n=1 Tax=Gryllus longicercus TaxID=2509291 RepID=A0AAN9Z658_9ORTH